MAKSCLTEGLRSLRAQGGGQIDIPGAQTVPAQARSGTPDYQKPSFLSADSSAGCDSSRNSSWSATHAYVGSTIGASLCQLDSVDSCTSEGNPSTRLQGSGGCRIPQHQRIYAECGPEHAMTQVRFCRSPAANSQTASPAMESLPEVGLEIKAILAQVCGLYSTSHLEFYLFVYRQQYH